MNEEVAEELSLFFHCRVHDFWQICHIKCPENIANLEVYNPHNFWTTEDISMI